MPTDEQQYVRLGASRVLECRCGNTSSDRFAVKREQRECVPGGHRSYRWAGWKCLECDAILRFSEEVGR